MVNPSRLKKKELVDYLTKRCKHRHLFSEHPNCFEGEYLKKGRVGFLDIETNGLQADFHIVGSYAIKVEGEDTIYGRAITKDELLSKTIDKDIVRDCVLDILRFDTIVTFNGTRFDLPFLRSRALMWGIEEFPLYGMVHHTDVYFMGKYKLRLHRRSLDAITRFLGIEGKNHVDGDHWVKAFLHADKKAFDYIFDHNKRDVLILEKVYNKLKDYCRNVERSL